MRKVCFSMPPPLTSISIGSHERLLADTLVERHKSGEGDLRLILRDGEVSVHAAVLAAVSPTMGAMLLQDEPAVIILPDHGVNEARNLVRLIYTGRTELLTEGDSGLARLQCLAKTLKCGPLSVSKEYRLYSNEDGAETACDMGQEIKEGDKSPTECRKRKTEEIDEGDSASSRKSARQLGTIKGILSPYNFYPDMLQALHFRRR